MRRNMHCSERQHIELQYGYALFTIRRLRMSRSLRAKLLAFARAQYRAALGAARS